MYVNESRAGLTVEMQGSSIVIPEVQHTTYMRGDEESEGKVEWVESVRGDL